MISQRELLRQKLERAGTKAMANVHRRGLKTKSFEIQISTHKIYLELSFSFIWPPVCINDFFCTVLRRKCCCGSFFFQGFITPLPIILPSFSIVNASVA